MAKTPVGRNATYLASLMGNIKTGSPINSPAAAFIVLFGLRFRSGNSGFEIPGLYVFAGALPSLVFLFRRSDSRHGLRAQGRDGGTGVEQPGGTKLFHSRQGLAAFQAEMIEEGVGRDPGDRPARGLAPALGLDPGRFQQ